MTVPARSRHSPVYVSLERRVVLFKPLDSCLFALGIPTRFLKILQIREGEAVVRGQICTDRCRNLPSTIFSQKVSFRELVKYNVPAFGSLGDVRVSVVSDQNAEFLGIKIAGLKVGAVAFPLTRERFIE
jgi:hypothetical protein